MATLRPTTRLVTRQLPRLTTTQTLLPKPNLTLRPSSTTHNCKISHTSLLIQRSLFHTSPPSHKQNSNPPLPSGIPPSKIYTFADIQHLSSHPTPSTLLIDVREPSELLATGRIPTAINIPIQTAPDSFFLPPEDFEDKYGFARPGEDTEVVFYCKAGVRSKAAARLAGQAGFGGKVGEFPGSWVEWVEKGGEVQKD